MNNIIIIGLQSAIENPLPDVNIYFTRIDELESFQEWKKNIIDSIRTEFNGNLDDEALDYFEGTLSGQQGIVFVSGKAKLIKYTWANGECKYIAIWNNKYIIQQEIYWIRFMPFLTFKNNSNLLVANIDTRKVEMFSSREGESVLLHSENNHFGHFVGDNLTANLLAILGPSFSGDSIKSRIPAANYATGIREIMETLCENRVEMKFRSKYKSIGKNCIIEDLLQIHSTSIASSTYLWEKWNPLKNLHNQYNSQESRIFLCRDGEYNTRIHNKRELQASLVEMGFEVLDPMTVSMKVFLIKLSKAKVIVAECGSTTISACYFSRNNCSIIGLCSKRLMNQPSMGMVHGGLPYILSFASKLKLFTGEPVVMSNIESSDVCWYNCNDLRSLVKNI